MQNKQRSEYGRAHGCAAGHRCCTAGHVAAHTHAMSERHPPPARAQAQSHCSFALPHSRARKRHRTAAERTRGRQVVFLPSLVSHGWRHFWQVVFLASFSEAERGVLLRHAAGIVYTPHEEHFGIVPLEAMCVT